MTTEIGLSWVDISTGKFMVQDINKSCLLDELSRINPSECVLPENFTFNEFDLSERISTDFNAMVTRRADWEFSRETAYQKLTNHFCTASLEGFGCEDIGPSLSAAGALINYLNETQKTSLTHINKIEKYSSQESPDPGPLHTAKPGTGQDCEDTSEGRFIVERNRSDEDPDGGEVDKGLAGKPALCIRGYKGQAGWC